MRYCRSRENLLKTLASYQSEEGITSLVNAFAQHLNTMPIHNIDLLQLVKDLKVLQDNVVYRASKKDK